MKEKVRYDSNRVRLHTGEYERRDGKYEYRYKAFGVTYSIFAPSLEELRGREENLQPVERERFARPDANRTTLNELFEMWKELKRGLRENTFFNYCYVYDHYVKEGLGRRYVASIKKSDIKRFFNHLVDEQRLKAGTVDGI